uniref:LSM14 domain-containing protein n=1 Tax=Mesocestoides corti TaxID=53468 RepID=A0A5K3FAT8_MESCO
MDNRFSNKMLSVTSRSGLGYVGRLHAIDTKHFTVTLSKVRVVNSANGDQIYPQVYDYVIFRGSDLQSVSVKELTSQDTSSESYLAIENSSNTLANPTKSEVRRYLYFQF